jgi:predicted nucleotidyltransferase
MRLANALFSKTQQQVLGLLYGQPDRDFYTNEIIKLSQSGTGAVQRELSKLAEAGIITVKEVGNQKRYQANRRIPFYPELRSIIVKTFGIADVIKEAIKPLTKKINLAFIYGSIAKGEDTEKSDIDVMIVSDKVGYSDFYKVILNAENKLGRKINPTFYTKTEWAKKRSDNHFVAKIIKQPMIMLITDEHESKQFEEFRKDRAIKT